MSVSISDLQRLNGQWIILTDFQGGVYEGYLRFNLADQFPIQIWSDGCCFITFILLEDVGNVIQALPRLLPNLPLHVRFFGMALPCLVQSSCCNQCLPEVLIMDVLEAENDKYKCLVGTSYILEWNFGESKYTFSYPSVCQHAYFHVNLTCIEETNWMCELYLMDKEKVTINGINIEFPLDCTTLMGVANVKLYNIETWTAEGNVKISFRPIQ